MLKADDLKNNTTCIDNKWVIARPLCGGFRSRVKDAIKVFTGKADAVSFYKQ
jgi:hypothetical protein